MAEGRKVRDRAEAQELLDAWKGTGEQLSKWCAARGINWYSLSTFKGWLSGVHRKGRRVRRRPAPRMVEIDVTPTVVTPRSRYRVELANGRTVEVDDAFEAQTLVRLLDVLERC